MLKISKNPEKFSPLKDLGIKLRSIGTTYENREIWMISLIVKDGKKKSAIWIVCAVHAREWISPSFCLYAIDESIKNSLLKNFDVFIVPVANPDGYEYSWTNNRLWRKNRRPKTAEKVSRLPSLECKKDPSFLNEQLLDVTQRSNQDVRIQKSKQTSSAASSFVFSPTSVQEQFDCKGIDINRNFDSYWAKSCGIHCNDFCSGTYPGTSPFSEAESRAIRDAVNSTKSLQDIAAFIDVHSYGQMWLSPYGWLGKYAVHNQELHRVAKVAVSALKSVNGTSYRYGSSVDLLKKNATGSTRDWAQQKVKDQIKYYS
jgi:hypothetical protein